MEWPINMGFSILRSWMNWIRSLPMWSYVWCSLWGLSPWLRASWIKLLSMESAYTMHGLTMVYTSQLHCKLIDFANALQFCLEPNKPWQMIRGCFLLINLLLGGGASYLVNDRGTVLEVQEEYNLLNWFNRIPRVIWEGRQKKKERIFSPLKTIHHPWCRPLKTRWKIREIKSSHSVKVCFKLILYRLL